MKTAPELPDSAGKIRLDKWLWQARFFKTRTLAAGQVSAGHVRVNGAHVTKPATSVRMDDVLTFAQGKQVRVVRIAALGTRRGPATEAQTLYTDLAPPERRAPAPENPGYDGGGRPTKRDRRKLDRDRSSTLE